MQNSRAGQDEQHHLRRIPAPYLIQGTGRVVEFSFNFRFFTGVGLIFNGNAPYYKQTDVTITKGMEKTE